MALQKELFTERKSLDEICEVPDKIISVYSLEKHVWADSNSEEARKGRRPELRTIEELQIDPVRHFLTDVFRNMAAPWKPGHAENPIGQGYWIQAEFGSGKSHLLSFLGSLALGSAEAWELVRKKEEKAGRGKRESLYRFWEEGIKGKGERGKRGIFVIVKTLVGAGGGAIGIGDKGGRLAEYILDAAKDQIWSELGKNVSLYPAEQLADRFMSQDLDRYRSDLKKFLKDPNYFSDDEFEDFDDFIKVIQQNKSPEYKKSCGNKLWRFYTEYLKVRPHIAAETEDVLRHLVETVLELGYSGVLLVLDEVSLFMKDRNEDQRTDDEKTLVVLSNILAKVKNLPVWTVCAAQQAIESKLGVKNIIADDRLKLVKLLEKDTDYYDIVLARVRELKNPSAVTNYYLHYKRGFTWPNSIGEKEFAHFFPFHKPALEVLRAVTFELTTARSAIHFMHQTLKHQVKCGGKSLVRLWELFDEAVQYEEDPSGTHAGLVAIKTRQEAAYKAYEACRRQVDALTKGYLKVHRDKAVKTIQTLFLYHVAKTRQQGIDAEEIANAVLIERDDEAPPDENIQHYETIVDNLRKELRQIVQTKDENNVAHYRFDPVFTGVDPRAEFAKARDEAEAHKKLQEESWDHLVALDSWPVRTKMMTIDLSQGVRSIFRDVSPFVGAWEEKASAVYGDQKLEIPWQGRQVSGLVGMRSFTKVAADYEHLKDIGSDETDDDFAVVIASAPVPEETIKKILKKKNDPRLILWTPDELNAEERQKLIDFAAYRRLVAEWQGKETEDAVAVISWVSSALQGEMGRIAKIVDSSYARGRVDSHKFSQMDFKVAGELPSIIAPLADRVLSAVYASREIRFEHPFIFKREEGIKVINGIVKTGSIPKNAKPNQNISAAQNFGFGLLIMKKSAERELDVSGNAFVKEMWEFIDGKLADESDAMKVDTLYKNFMGIGGPKDYGLTRRMVQIYLLCLAQQGKIRIAVSPKAGLTQAHIDYANIGSVDFSAKILDNMGSVQKMARPENWEALLPFAEKLLEKPVPSTHDDALISGYRDELRALFEKERERSEKARSRIESLFSLMTQQSPYEKELSQAARLFSIDVGRVDDITTILYALKEVFGYDAHDSGTAQPADVDDLGLRLADYRNVLRFLDFEQDVRVLNTYCEMQMPALPSLQPAAAAQAKLREKLKRLKTYIDSEVKLRTELIGKTPPDPGEKDTLGVLVREYLPAYWSMHEHVLAEAEKNEKIIEDLLDGAEMKALPRLEGITALHPPFVDALRVELSRMAGQIFTCESSSRGSVENALKQRGPLHDCNLSFEDADGLEKAAQSIADKAVILHNDTISKKMAVFLSPAVRERLEQGKSEKVIAGLLSCSTVDEVRSYLVEACAVDQGTVATINRYLKQIKVKHVRMSDFKPKTSTVEREQIEAVAGEFRLFLEGELASLGENRHDIPMLQID